MEEDLVKFQQQHINNYRNAVLEIIRNNTVILVDEDITSLFKKPPLDSMDLLKVKILSLAKKNKLIFHTDELDKILDSYRNNILKCCSKLKKIRLDSLIKKVESIDLENHSIIKINKKDFILINKEFKKIMKEQLQKSFESCILKKIHLIFPDGLDKSLQDNIISDFTKYMTGIYRRQILESFDIKILVKDTTLMNSTKEQAEHYLFTLKKSRLFQDI